MGFLFDVVLIWLYRASYISNIFIIRDFFYSYEDTAWRKLEPSKRKMGRKYNNTLEKRQHVTRYLIFTVLVKVQYIPQFITWICAITLLNMTFTALKCNIWAASANPKLVNLSIIRSYWHSVLNMNIIFKYIRPCVLPQIKSIYITSYGYRLVNTTLKNTYYVWRNHAPWSDCLCRISIKIW